MDDLIPFEKGFSASRSSPGSENVRSLRLEYSTNGSIYLTEHEYGGRTLCPTKEDLRWLRDVLNRLEFCDHTLGEIKQFTWARKTSSHRECTKCGTWVYEGPVTTDISSGHSAELPQEKT